MVSPPNDPADPPPPPVEAHAVVPRNDRPAPGPAPSFDVSGADGIDPSLAGGGSTPAAASAPPGPAAPTASTGADNDAPPPDPPPDLAAIRAAAQLEFPGQSVVTPDPILLEQLRAELRASEQRVEQWETERQAIVDANGRQQEAAASAEAQRRAAEAEQAGAAKATADDATPQSTHNQADHVDGASPPAAADNTADIQSDEDFEDDEDDEDYAEELDFETAFSKLRELLWDFDDSDPDFRITAAHGGQIWRGLGPDWGLAPTSEAEFRAWADRYRPVVKLVVKIQHERDSQPQLKRRINWAADPVPRDHQQQPLTNDVHLRAERTYFQGFKPTLPYGPQPWKKQPFARGGANVTLPYAVGEWEVFVILYRVPTFYSAPTQIRTYTDDSAKEYFRAWGLEEAPEEVLLICRALLCHDEAGIDRLAGWLRRNPEHRVQSAGTTPPTCDSYTGISFIQALTLATQILDAEDLRRAQLEELLPAGATGTQRLAAESYLNCRADEATFRDSLSPADLLDPKTQKALQSLSVCTERALRSLDRARAADAKPPAGGVVRPAAAPRPGKTGLPFQSTPAALRRNPNP
ncbi:hypothetical protein Pla175_28810 [Pirellulimonas nuda]|uniref:Uncharacterized protein n=1 Tax=Pirellulimonas nuda TaxID=2528009 RepID=A0A518DDE7_9BACT|nr:hypothetical protein [Pirellulimonas nuda]QDU89490.1 hypothetical protein Pla175_28810 [Pirellulimonas nuda]